MKKELATDHSERLKYALKQIQLRAQVQRGRTLTQDALAEMAGVSKRSLGDWMRGVSAPSGMGAILELLSQLNEGDVLKVLNLWRDWSPPVSSLRKKATIRAEKLGRPLKKTGLTTTKAKKLKSKA